MHYATRKFWLLPAFLALAGTACLWIDYRIGRWCFDNNPELQALLHPQPPANDENSDSPKVRHSPLHAFHKIFDFSEIYADGVGVGLLILTLFVVDAGRRWQFPRLIAASLGAGLVTDLIKICIVRYRPKEFFKFADTNGLWDTFVFQDWHLNFKSAWQSFPSGHATTAAGFTLVLIMMYPRGRWLFPIFAILASAQRVISSYHFPSDVFWGAAVGSTVGWLCLNGPLGRFFDRLEEKDGAK